MSKDLVCNKIYSTKEYSKFKYLIGNREVKESHIKDMERSFTKIGQLDIPILINENWEIIEGQHRFEACKRNGFEVKYTMQRGNIGLEECQVLNSKSSNWKLGDYIKSFSDKGNKSYVFLRRLMELHPSVSYSQFAACLFGRDKMSSSLITEGNLVISEGQMNLAHKILDWVEPIMLKYDSEEFKGPKHYLAVALCLVYKYHLDGLVKVDLSRLEQILEEPPIRRKVWGNTETCVEELENCYNHNLKKRPKVFFYNTYREEKKKR